MISYFLELLSSSMSSFKISEHEWGIFLYTRVYCWGLNKTLIYNHRRIAYKFSRLQTYHTSWYMAVSVDYSRVLKVQIMQTTCFTSTDEGSLNFFSVEVTSADRFLFSWAYFLFEYGSKLEVFFNDSIVRFILIIDSLDFSFSFWILYGFLISLSTSSTKRRLPSSVILGKQSYTIYQQH